MNEALRYTLRKMYEMADRYRGDISRRFSDIAEVFTYVKNIPYVRDIESCEREECLKRPFYTMRDGGDCDDKAILAGAIFTNMGITWRYVTTGYGEGSEQQHVYLELWNGKKWLPFDATYSHNRLYLEGDFTSKLIWDNPMLRNGPYNIATLEGVGVVPAVVSAITTLASVQRLLATVPIIGGLFKGGTKHIDVDTAAKKVKEYGDGIMKLYGDLDGNGKSLMFDLVRNRYFIQNIRPTFGTYWNNDINNRVNFVVNENPSRWDSSMELQVWTLSTVPLGSAMVHGDADRISEEILPFIKLYNDTVLVPISSYLASKGANFTVGPDGIVNVTPGTLPGGGSNPGSDPNDAKSNMGTIPLIVGGLLLLGLSTKKK